MLGRTPAGFVDGPNLYAYVRQNPWTGWDPKGLAEITIDTKDPQFHALVTTRMEAELRESTTARSLNQAAKDLPNKIIIAPAKSGNAQPKVDQTAGVATIYVNPATMNDATISHETAHLIQTAASTKQLQTVEQSGHRPGKEELERAHEAGRDALNNVVPVKSAKDGRDETLENEATRVTNIVTAERTATDMKNTLPREAQTPEEFWKRQKPKELEKHQHNSLPLPERTKYGGYDFKPVKDTLGYEQSGKKKPEENR